LKEEQKKKQAAVISVVAGLTLSTLKFFVGFTTGSLGIISEALHSLLDLGASVITFFSVRLSIKPPDSNHNYGHGKIENLSAIAQGLLLLGTCIWIVIEAIERLSGKDVNVEATISAFVVMAISVVVDAFTSFLLYRAARKYSSQALEGDALHYFSDIFSSIVVLIGLGGVKLGISSLDSISALCVSVIIAVASFRLMYRSVQELLDIAPKGVREKIMVIMEKIPQIRKVERIRVRRSGPRFFVDMVISTKRLMSIDESNELADRIEREIQDVLPESDVMVHFHPSKEEGLQEKIFALINNPPEGIQDIHDVKIFKDEGSSGNFLSIHAKLNPNLSLEEGHSIVSEFERSICREVKEINSVVTHIETSYGSNSGKRVEMDDEIVRVIRDAILKDERIDGIHDVYLHSSKEGSFLSCHVSVKNSVNLEEAHKLSTLVEEKIRNILPDLHDIVIHTEPKESG